MKAPEAKMNDRLWVVFNRYKGTKKWNTFYACSTFKAAFEILTDHAKDTAKFKMVQYMPVPEQVAPLLRRCLSIQLLRFD
jgi:hypothetical protein